MTLFVRYFDTVIFILAKFFMSDIKETVFVNTRFGNNSCLILIRKQQTVLQFMLFAFCEKKVTLLMYLCKYDDPLTLTNLLKLKRKFFFEINKSGSLEIAFS